ncbi:MAG: alpha/beta fold hydrolase [Deltaproteobacteria bacterium]|nr:alpha/beta fold hydrolase [Deltaproteobacteria bacterium]
MPEVDWKKLVAVVGKATVRGGRFVGRKAAEAYRSIDPDVMRHLAQVPLLSYSLLVSREEKIEAGEPDGHPPLVFVHGLGGNRGNFLLMAWYLRLKGRRRSYKIHFDPGQSIAEMAAALARFIRAVKKATGESQVEIVAHSLGGIVARMAIEKHRLASSVATLVTLGTPHKGTYPARYANTVNTREIRPDSALICELNKRPWPGRVRGVTFWSRGDLFVLPAESAAVPGTETVDMTPFTHYSYLLDPKSFAAVADALKTRPKNAAGR